MHYHYVIFNVLIALGLLFGKNESS